MREWLTEAERLVVAFENTMRANWPNLTVTIARDALLAHLRAAPEAPGELTEQQAFEAWMEASADEERWDGCDINDALWYAWQARAALAAAPEAPGELTDDDILRRLDSAGIDVDPLLALAVARVVIEAAEIKAIDAVCDSYAAENQRFSDEIDRLRAALAAPAGEPVGWVTADGFPALKGHKPLPPGTLLYTRPSVEQEPK
jgi:hypothetical protein